jgi:urea transport system substrate-binding protein
MKLGSIVKTGLVAAGVLAGAAGSAFAQGAPIKVGILHSLSGTMAISETTLKDTMLFLIDEQNKKGGLLGKQLEAVVVDPASDWPLFAEKARELIEKDKVGPGGVSVRSFFAQESEGLLAVARNAHMVGYCGVLKCL